MKLTLDNTLKQRDATHYLAVFVWLGWHTLYALFFCAFPLLAYMHSRLLLVVLLAMSLSLLFPITRSAQPRFGFALGEWILHKASEYFKMRIVVEDEEALEKCGPAIFILEPHDILPLSIFAFNDCVCHIKGQRMLGCITTACFNVPFMRQIYTWVNAVPVDRKSLENVIAQGHSPVICPGGVQETVMLVRQQQEQEANKDIIILYLLERKGFVKLALQHGRPLVPCFSFGLRNSFDFIGTSNSTIFALGRAVGGLPLLFFGFFGVPFGPPKPCQYTNVIGKPLFVPHIAQPSQEDVDKYHALFIEALRALFEATKQEYGEPNVSLRIV